MKTFRSPLRTLAMMAVVALAACTTAEETAEQEEMPAAEEPAAEPAGQMQELPDTTADAVWAYLQAQDYQSWPLFPGTEELYQGQDPHGALLTTYVNQTALAAVEGGAEGELPVGAMLVKENYSPDSTLMAVTVMYKTESFNPEHRNFWFLKRNRDGSIDAAGRGEGCQNCHMGAPGNDYRFLSAADGEMQ